MRLINILLLAVVFATFGCKKDPVGYLMTENASYAISTLDVYHLEGITDSDPIYYDHFERIRNKAPWVSLTMDGVLGTNPIYYEVSDVKASEGGNAEMFRSEVSVEGGGKIVFPFAYKSPKGKYLISIKLRNEGQQRIVNDIFTIIIH